MSLIFGLISACVGNLVGKMSAELIGEGCHRVSKQSPTVDMGGIYIKKLRPYGTIINMGAPDHSLLDFVEKINSDFSG